MKGSLFQEIQKNKSKKSPQKLHHESDAVMTESSMRERDSLCRQYNLLLVDSSSGMSYLILIHLLHIFLSPLSYLIAFCRERGSCFDYSLNYSDFSFLMNSRDDRHPDFVVPPIVGDKSW